MSGVGGRARGGRRPRRAPAAGVTLRAATAGDSRRVWRWRNDEETRRASFDSAPIPLETHERWFLDSLRRRGRHVYVVLAGGRPAGVARLDVIGREAAVSIHLAPERRGRGIGPAALRALGDLAFRALRVDRLVASVKPDNARSLSAFERAGFVRLREGASVELMRSRHRGLA